jgi:hypothetical protein
MRQTSIRKSASAAGMMLFLVLAAGNCHSRPPAPPQRSTQDIRITAASLFTKRYARSRLSGWHLRASAAGADCAVLFVDVPIVMEDSMIEAMHYGAGAYEVYAGGVQHFYRERTFRGVAYRDASGRVWTYGAVSRGEAGTLAACH